MPMKKYPAQLKQFGARVKEFRESLEWSQVVLAKQTGVDVRTIQRIEAGKGTINLRTIFALAEALYISTEDLFNRTETPWLKRPRY